MGNKANDKKVDVADSGLTPWQIIQSYDDTEWEHFIAEWSEGFIPPYEQVIVLGGAGDKGRDVIGYVTDPTDPAAEWDSFQCKHYRSPLMPTNIYVELAKLCFYTHRGDYTVPRKYRFVSPRGVGTKLHDLLKKPDNLRTELLSNWDKHCRHAIQEDEVPLDSALEAYIKAFDFSIVWFVTPQEILNQHERTKYSHRRFKIAAPKRPDFDDPPNEVSPSELVYTRCLLDAYSDHLKCQIAASEDLVGTPHLHDHFKRSRYSFYSADALARFSRDHFGNQPFLKVKKNVFDGVVDVTLADHKDGFQCVLGVTKAAAGLQLPASDITPHVTPADKIGLCHHLANDGDMKWCGNG